MRVRVSDINHKPSIYALRDCRRLSAPRPSIYNFEDNFEISDEFIPSLHSTKTALPDLLFCLCMSLDTFVSYFQRLGTALSVKWLQAQGLVATELKTGQGPNVVQNAGAKFASDCWCMAFQNLTQALAYHGSTAFKTSFVCRASFFEAIKVPPNHGWLCTIKKRHPKGIHKAVW